MPAVSKKQQKFFGIVRAIQKGEMAPTTPETAKAAADMKKGDVKKFASTKHKGLPEKKKIEEDRQINKIIKQLRKSVKAHKKQADTLEKKVKTFKESAFTNITVGNKIGQTFQHATGATITLDNTMSDPSDLPSQVTISLPFGDGDITVDAPSTNEYGIAGITSSLGNAGGGGGVQTRQPTKTADEINQQLDASQEASGAETAKVEDIPDQPTFDDIETSTEKAIKNLIGHIGGYQGGAPQRGEIVGHVVDRGMFVVDTYMKQLSKSEKSFTASVDKMTREYNAYKKELDDSDLTFAQKNKLLLIPKKNLEKERGILNHIKQDYQDLKAAKPQIKNIFQQRSKKNYEKNRNKQNQIRQDYQRITNYGDHDVSSSDYNLDDNDMFDQKADEFGVSTSKDMFDFYMDKFVDNPTNKSVNVNSIFKPHLNTIKGYLPEIEKLIKLGQLQGDSTEKIQKDINDHWNNVISANMPSDLRNSLGNGSQLDVEKYLKTGNWQVNKTFVFTEPNDFQGRDLGPGGLFNRAPQLYAIGKSFQKGTRGDLRPYVNVPMNYNITISGSEAKTSGPHDLSKYTPQQIKTAADMHISVETLVNSHNRAIKAGSKNSGIDSKTEGLIKAGNWSWSDYIDRTNAINMAASDKAEPLHKKLRELPVDNRPNRGPSKASLALSDAIEKITLAAGKQLEALWNAWTEYNKLEEPPTTGGELKGGQGGKRLGSTTQRQGGAYNPRNPYGTGLDRGDTSFKKTKKQKKNVRGSGMRGRSVKESKLSFELIQQFREESNPRIPRKKGQPANSKKHSDLYTDENPKGTIHGLGFKNVAKAKASVSKIRNSSRSHAHKIQAAVAMEQRAREMGKTSEAAVYRKYINSMKKKTKKMNEAANPAQQAAIAISMKKKGIKPKNLKEQTTFAQMQQRIRDAKEKRREQQKKSEKLYIDTKRKGVKFYDKKGSGRLKDGKKIYD